MKIQRTLVIFVLVAVMAGCASVPMNAPLTEPTAGSVTTAAPEPSQTDSDIAVILTFSGGGMRASALAYGVLEELRDTRITTASGEKRLLDEVDMISSVSGGSLTAAYYGLYGERIFRDYVDTVLRRNLSADLGLTLRHPGNWFRLGSGLYGRSDLAAEVYDRLFFRKATFGELQRRAPCRIALQATDLSRAVRFAFTPEQFRLLCSDYDSYPVSRGVVASSAVPVLYSPIALRTYVQDCPTDVSAELSRLPTGLDADIVASNARRLGAYVATDAGEYLHLVDGAIVDYLGVRGVLDEVIEHGGWQQWLHAWNLDRHQRIVVIVVNAEIHPVGGIGEQPTPPSAIAAWGVVKSVQVNSYNVETTHRLRTSLARWARGEQANGTSALGERRAHVIEVDFDGLSDEGLRDAVRSLSTRLTLSDAAVERVRQAGRRGLAEHADFQELLQDLDGVTTGLRSAADSGR